MRLTPPEYHPVPGYDALWSEDDRISRLEDDEVEEYAETVRQFPLHSEIRYSCTVMAGIYEEGIGKVIGYCLRTSKSLFHHSYLYLLVMTKKGLTNINLTDAELSMTHEDVDLCSTIAMGM